MLAKAYRVRKSQEFNTIYRRSKKIYAKYFTFYCHFTNPNESKGTPVPHFGFVVSKKVGNAVVRNKAKRRLREIVRLLLPRLKPNFDGIILAKPEIATAEYQEISNDVLKVFDTLMLISE